MTTSIETIIENATCPSCLEDSGVPMLESAVGKRGPHCANCGIELVVRVESGVDDEDGDGQQWQNYWVERYVPPDRLERIKQWWRDLCTRTPNQG